MHYLSTRGAAPVLDFPDVLLSGLARDGGLYLPECWPQLTHAEITGLAGAPYTTVAKRVIAPYVDDTIEDDALDQMIADAYATFRHRAVAPLVQIGDNDWILELFHGPTLAFKDVAMQLLARLMDHVLAKRGQRATIVGATSGDTGGAAIDAFKESDRVDMFILFPDGRVSDVQRRQMTTVGGRSIHALAIDGTFDDCQALVKGMFNDFTFRDSVRLSGVNSINWARIMAQIVYYVTSATALGSPDRAVSFAVPTGNFGDILAGYAAKRMGLPIDRLLVATNENDILARALKHGRYETDGVVKTQSPSMDIQVSSNFERALFEAADGDAATIARLMESLKQSGSFTIPETILENLRAIYDASKIDETDAPRVMKSTLAETGYLADPHTAIGLGAMQIANRNASPMVTLSTAHPAKFPEAVEAATGQHPTLPDFLADLHEREERMVQLPNELAAVEDYIAGRSRAATNRGAA